MSNEFENLNSSITEKETTFKKNFISSRIPNVKNGSFLYVLLVVLFLTLGYITQSINVHFGIIFTEVVVLGVTAYLYSKFKKYDIKMTFGLDKAKKGTILRSIFIMLMLYPVAIAINVLFLNLITKFIPMPENLNSVPLPVSFGGLIVSVLLFAILPGIFEELIFRGILYRAFDVFKPVYRILLTGFLFGLFHFNPYNFIGPFILGLVLGYMRYKSNSIVPSMFGHATNNTIAMILGYIANSNSDKLADVEAMGQVNLNSNLTPFSIIIVLLFLGLFIFGLYKLIKNYPSYQEKINIIRKPETSELIFISLIILVSLAIFGYTVFMLKKAI